MTEVTEEMINQARGMLTTRQAALRANRHQRTIVAWIQEGKLNALKLPGGRGQYFIHAHELDALVSRLSTPLPYTPKEKDEH